MSHYAFVRLSPLLTVDSLAVVSVEYRSASERRQLRRRTSVVRTTCLRGPLNFERLPSSVDSLAPAFSSHELPARSTTAPRHWCRSTVGLYRPPGLRLSVSFHRFADLEPVSSVRCTGSLLSCAVSLPFRTFQRACTSVSQRRIDLSPITFAGR